MNEPPDILELANGSSLEGKILSATPSAVTISIEGTTLTIQKSGIKNIIYGSPKPQEPESPTNTTPQQAP